MVGRPCQLKTIYLTNLVCKSMRAVHCGATPVYKTVATVSCLILALRKYQSGRHSGMALQQNDSGNLKTNNVRVSI